MAKEQGLTLSNNKTGFLGSLNQGIRTAVKSYLFGNDLIQTGADPTLRDEYTTQTWYEWLTGFHSFNRKNLEYLVETGYSTNPVGFGIVQKISLSSRNIVYTPYRNGKPYKSAQGQFDLDIPYALTMLATTGTVFIWNKEVSGFGRRQEVLNTLRISERCRAGVSRWYYDIGNGMSIEIPQEDLAIEKFADIQQCMKTNMGLSPFQAAIMPIESLKEMYVADTSLLKNKGVDALITNGSDTQMLPYEQDEMDKVLNDRIAGAKKTGRVATSTAKLEVHNLGRSVKDLALWDGYKIKARDLCMALQFPSSLANDPDYGTFANYEQSCKALYTECVIPFVRKITENKKLRDFLGYDVFLDTSNIEVLQTSQKEKFEKNQTITNTVVSLNKSVKSGEITSEIAIKLLVNEWGYDEEEARMIVIPDPVSTTTEPTTEEVPPIA